MQYGLLKYVIRMNRLMQIALREPVPGDIGWLISMHGALYEAQFNFDAQFERDIANKVARFFEDQSDFNRILIATVDGERAGSIAVSLRLERTAFINFLLVVQKYQGHGIARRMMEETIVYSKEHGLKRIRLETYSCLTAARELYRKFVFKQYLSNKDLHIYGQTFDQEFWEKVI